MPFFLVEANGQGAPFHQASGPWLEAAPRGAYTTARTVGGDAVLELSFHIERLANTAKLMIMADEESAALHSEAAAPAALPTAADPELLRPRVLAAMRAAVQGYRSATGDAAGEVRLTVLVTWPGCQQQQPAHPAGASSSSSSSSSSSQSDALAPSAGADQPGVLVHVSSLPPRPAPPVRVVMRGAPRQNAEAKDSEWVRQRKCLQEGLPQPTEEVLLVGADGSIYEGLSSNFFALCADGKLHTAGDGILAGTVREVALAVARREGIPVVLQPPRLADLERWQGCFISSTSRLLLPVDEAGVFPQGGHEPGAADNAPVQLERVRRFESGGLVQRLEQLVLAELVACSEPLYS
ncbi:hypothetical protein D9Q98_002131 [Chlorella vulgaris]|uniref:Uncharacterized protein n=1 Tax=Chlorella vulgaris TaxID=3077 RepID=A0A9D4TVU5_CHLVU|nr:hypothetical protein D9Q98_002131 [Chlorella vulgaris]